MEGLFIFCGFVGGGMLVLQIVLSLFGLEHGLGVHGMDAHGGMHDQTADHAVHDAAGHAPTGHVHEALNLTSVRALSAAAAFFGIVGYGIMRAGWPTLLALLLAGVAGVAGAAGVAWAMRTMMRAEADGSLVVEGAIGEPAQVHVAIPPAGQGRGKVLLTLQGRTVEFQADTTAAKALPSGTTVLVTDIKQGDLVTVIPFSPTEDHS